METVPREEIECIRVHKEEAIPKMLEFLRRFVKREEPLPEYFIKFHDPIFYMFLLAEFRVHEAFRIDKAFDEGVVDPFLMGEDDFYIVAETPEKALEVLHGPHPPEKVRFVNDTIREIDWWACFKKEKTNKSSAQKIAAPSQINNIVPEVKKKPAKKAAVKKPPEKKKPKIGKNDLCPCGSGKMYKNCCLKKDRRKINRKKKSVSVWLFL